jgi:hypothetical protein
MYLTQIKNSIFLWTYSNHLYYCPSCNAYYLKRKSKEITNYGTKIKYKKIRHRVIKFPNLTRGTPFEAILAARPLLTPVAQTLCRVQK